MQTLMYGLLAETSIHPGTGRSMGVVDLPVAREAATSYPVLVGSSLKGALRDRAGGDTEDAKRLFGQSDDAGEVLVGDGRLVLLPVRCLTGAFRWVTCPHLIERHLRDRKRAELPASFAVPVVEHPADKSGQALGSGSGKLFLEEREFELVGEPDNELVLALEQLIADENARKRLRRQLVVLPDDDFAWFARYGLSIQARNKLDPKTKQSKSLWYEETLPPETVFSTLIAGRSDDALTRLRGLFPPGSAYLQAGGNETVGQGWFAVTEVGSTKGGER